MGDFSESRVLNGQYAYRVIKILASKENGDYGRNIAEELDSDEEEVSRCFSQMKKLNLIKKGKRGRAQYYVPDYKGMQEYVINNFELEDQEDFTDFLDDYVFVYTDEKDESSIKQMLTTDLFQGLFTYSERYKEELPENLDQLLHNLVEHYELEAIPGDIVNTAVKLDPK